MPRRTLLLATAVLAVGCQPQPAPESTAPARSEWPTEEFEAATARGAPLHRVDPKHSSIEMVIRRDGRLARFGHDHVITAEYIEGWVLESEPLCDGRGELRIVAEQLVVDSPEARARYALDTDPSADDIIGTRENMLNEVLQAKSWPDITVVFRGSGKTGTAGCGGELEVNVAGNTHVQEVAPEITRIGSADDPRGGLWIVGQTTLLQSDLGIEPFSVFGGGLRVADEIEIHYRIVTGRASASDYTELNHP